MIVALSATTGKPGSKFALVSLAAAVRLIDIGNRTTGV
jgi:hypothetical protein